MAKTRKSDRTVIRAALAGNVDAFGPLVDRYQEGVYAAVWSMVRDFASTEDIAREAFITAYRRLSDLRDPAAFPARLRRIAVNAARMWLREQSSRETTLNADHTVASKSRVGPRTGFRKLAPERRRPNCPCCCMTSGPVRLGRGALGWDLTYRFLL